MSLKIVRDISIQSFPLSPVNSKRTKQENNKMGCGGYVSLMPLVTSAQVRNTKEMHRLCAN
jgi:hypothetical protein